MLGYLQFLKGSPMRSSSRQQAWLGMALCAAAMATVGSTVVASRLIAAGLPPFTATALRFAVAADRRAIAINEAPVEDELAESE